MAYFKPCTRSFTIVGHTLPALLPSWLKPTGSWLIIRKGARKEKVVSLKFSVQFWYELNQANPRFDWPWGHSSCVICVYSSACNSTALIFLGKFWPNSSLFITLAMHLLAFFFLLFCPFQIHHNYNKDQFSLPVSSKFVIIKVPLILHLIFFIAACAWSCLLALSICLLVFCFCFANFDSKPKKIIFCIIIFLWITNAHNKLSWRLFPLAFLPLLSYT